MHKARENAVVRDHRLTLPEVLDALAEDGLLPQGVADDFKRERRYFKGDAHPLVILADQKWRTAQEPHKALTLEYLSEWLARRVGLDYLHIDPLKIDFHAVTDVISNAYATRFRILPVEVTTREVVIATAEPYLREWENELKPILRKEIRRVVANPLDIERYLVEFYNLARSVKKAMKDGESRGGISNFEQLVELGKTNKQFDANDQHIVSIVDWLWQYAFEQRASDIHVEPRRELGIVRFRIDGVLHQVYQIPMSVLNAMTSRIKILGRMDVVEKRRPQDGRIKTRTSDGQEIELRLSTLPTAFGEKLVMRIFDPEVLVRDFAELGFSDDDKARWNQMVSQPNGIVLVTGPTGSGKTTTLYGALTEIHDGRSKIITIEDPVEYQLPGILQIPVNEKKGLTFAKGLRSILRHDPDKIMVGEIRDHETAEIAVQSALTGHLVLTTVHANNVFDALGRFTHLGIDAYSFVSALNGIWAQRLVRVNCPHCAVAHEPTDEELALLRLTREEVGTFRFLAGQGCGDCRGTGYKGRRAIAEILILTDEIRELIVDKTPIRRIKEVARQQGTRSLREAALVLARNGETTLAEVNRVTLHA